MEAGVTSQREILRDSPVGQRLGWIRAYMSTEVLNDRIADSVRPLET